MMVNKVSNEKQIGVRVTDGVHTFFLRGTGGNNRAWAKRYKKMIEFHKMLADNADTEEKKHELVGYERCMKMFFGRE